MSNVRYPRTVDEIYRDYAGRKEALKRALGQGMARWGFVASNVVDGATEHCIHAAMPHTDQDQFYQQCDPAKENLCLYGRCGCGDHWG